MTTPHTYDATGPAAGAPVRIPADVDMDDRILGRLTARQVAILGATAAVLYLVWLATSALVPVWVFLAAAVPVAATAVALATGRRDGTTLDRYALAAATHYAHTRTGRPPTSSEAPPWLTGHATPTSPGPADPRRPRSPVQLPPRQVDVGFIDAGVIDLGADGSVVLAVASAVDFALRAPHEQDQLVATFARYLHSLHAPVQLLIRALPLDMTAAVGQLRGAAPGLEHPALTAAALDHADYLAWVGEGHELLHRQIIVVFREPAGPTIHPTRHRGPHRGAVGGSDGGSHGGRHRGRRKQPRAGQVAAGRERLPGDRAVAVQTRLGHRLAEAVELLAPAGITLTPLDPARAAAVLASACHPAGHYLPPAPPTHPDTPITGPWRSGSGRSGSGRSGGRR